SSTVKSSTVKSSTVKSTARSKSSTGPAATEDVVLVHGRSEDGALQVIRKKGDELSAGELRPVEEGKPLRGNLLKLRPREDMPLLADVEEEIAITSPSLSKPAQVATDSYRKGWDGLWGARKKRSAAN
ncbi:MAG: hypothetical protein MUE69_31870, partial [Myxococcota bacterium]|nr:hypothetical protein [Myxococcota bacterium]